MKTAFVRTGLLVGLCALAAPAAAHHSFAAVFDRDQPIEITGIVTSIEWLNPHVWFYVDVQNEEGEIENWGFEMGSPNGLIRRGWNHNSLQVGAEVSVVGVLARDGSQRAAVRTVTLSTGESLFGAQDESR
ncbi:MAG TPA: DUF6152 family protein [Gammaproteobacteria bacterium]|nr:DUF6152 family protein [Gammaproteobacteria bacterium]